MDHVVFSEVTGGRPSSFHGVLCMGDPLAPSEVEENREGVGFPRA